jgi:hypothetical protein
MRSFRIVAFLLLPLVTTAAVAGRKEFLATFDGERLSGSSVCFFPATSDDGFFLKFLSSDDVRCLSADAVIDMPVGNWNVFVHHERAYTSTHPTFQYGDQETDSDRQAYRPVRVTMRPAARLRFGTAYLEQGVRPVVYFPNLGNDDEPATVRPLIAGKDHILVPASTPVVPLLVRGTQIVRVGNVVTFPHGVTAEASFPNLAPGRRDVVALMRVLGEREEAENREDRLELHLDTREGVLAPVVPPRTGLELDRSLAIFRNVPAGQATLVIAGRRWASQRIAVAPAATGVQMLDTPVGLRRAGEVLLTWTAPATLASDAPCRQTPPRPPVFRVRLERCEAECQVISDKPLDEEDRSARFDGLMAGTYRVSLGHTVFGSTARDVEVRRGTTTDVVLELAPVTITGSVKLGEEDLRADVTFVTGRATTDMNGRYIAVLPRDPGRETVSVLPCDDGDEYVAVPREPLSDGSVFDIVVPRTSVSVAIHDQQSGAPLQDAAVVAAVLFDRDGDEHFFLETTPTTAEGHASIRRIAPDVWLRVCASKTGYTTRCSPSFQLAADEEKALRIDLIPETAVHGRIVANAPIFRGLLYWIAPNGGVTERRSIAEDGTFSAALPHAADEYVVFIASNHPLHVLRPVRDPVTNSLTMPLPPLPVHDVLLVPRSFANARVALEVDGYLVPEQVFAQHQIMRGAPAAIHQAASLRVTGIAGHQWAVLVGPPTNFTPPGAPDSLDLSTVPQFRATFRRFPVQAPVVEVD